MGGDRIFTTGTDFGARRAASSWWENTTHRKEIAAAQRDARLDERIAVQDGARRSTLTPGAASTAAPIQQTVTTPGQVTYAPSWGGGNIQLDTIFGAALQAPMPLRELGFRAAMVATSFGFMLGFGYITQYLRKGYPLKG